MKTAIIFYSFEGSSALVAETIKEVLAADVFEIKTVDTMKRTGLGLYAWGGRQVVMRTKPDLVPLNVDVNAYDLIILGTPVWAWSPSPPMYSFLSKTSISGKKIALFCCHGGGKGKVFDKFKAMLPGNTFVGEIDFMNPAKEGRDALKKKIEEWLRGMGEKG